MATFVRDPSGWKKAFQSTEGIVGAHFKSIGHRGMMDAKARVGVKTWALYHSINHRTGIMSGNVYTDYGSNNRVALMHYTGTKAHRISARNPQKMLKFYWTKRRRWVLVHSVWHPGTDPNPYLTYNLRNYIL